MDKSLNRVLKFGSTVINNVILLNLKELQMSSNEFVVFSIIEMYSQKGNSFPTMTMISDSSGLSEDDVYQIVQSLMKKDFIEIRTQVNKTTGKQQDIFDTMPIYDQLEKILSVNENAQKKEAEENNVSDLFKSIEVEFGRPLSPIEQETIYGWVNDDHYSIELIKLALKEAVLNQAYSLKYMDKILITWEKQNIKTAAQLEEKRRRQEF